MPYRNKLRSSKIFTLSFIVAIFILFFISIFSYRKVKSLGETEQLVSHTFTIQVALEQLYSMVKDAETGQRGFIITQDSSFLKPYFNSIQKVDSIYGLLKELTKDNEIQKKNLDKLRPLVNRRFELLSEHLTEASVSEKAIKSDAFRVKMLLGKNVMDLLRHQLDDMIKMEGDILKKRQADHKSRLSITPFFSLMLLFFSLLMFIAAFYKINNDLKRLQLLNNELVLTKESFEHAEEIANISHWEWNLQNNQLSYSDNQYYLLGCRPGEFEPTVENFLQFVHPEDKHIVVEGGDRALIQNQASEVVFRVIRKDGSLRYFKSTGRLLDNELGENIIVGINYDITNQYLANQHLEEKNRELTQSNIELASFNHIASHDLQEPLRKIQLFISKIIGDEDLQLPEKHQDYFMRVQASASRMQALIDDLLSYSKISGGDKIFEDIDLNEVLQHVVSDLLVAQNIEDNEINIQFSNLPVVQGIWFQLKQLFTNLLENSVKYKNAGRALSVTIQSKIVNSAEIPGVNIHDSRKYHQISVADNGMGFEQKYAEQIFTLFQRLHDKQSYSGTGIGLAICKKVAENHHGFMCAIGMPEQGAIFYIYLPVKE